MSLLFVCLSKGSLKKSYQANISDAWWRGGGGGQGGRKHSVLGQTHEFVFNLCTSQKTHELYLINELRR